MTTMHRRVPLLILGAGMAGLGAGVQAQRLGIESLLLEAEPEIGGLCRSLTSITGCCFDFGPKILILDDSDNSKDILRFLNGNYNKYPLQESVYLKEFGLVGFPIQRNLIDLPKETTKQVLSQIELSMKHNVTPATYKEWLLAHYGEYLTNNVLLPYEEKKWQISLDRLDYTWTLSRPASAPITEIKRGAIQKLPPKKHYYYPQRGAITTLTKTISQQAGKILLNHKVESVNVSRKTVTANGKIFQYDTLVSTLPLDYMLDITQGDDKKPEGYCSILKQLDIRVFHLVFGGNHKLDGTAIYFPEDSFIFRRVSVLQNLCPALARDGYTPISVEVSLGDKTKAMTRYKMQQLVVNQLRHIEQFKSLGDPVDTTIQDIQNAYPLPLIGLNETVDKVHEFYLTKRIYPCGRGGNYDYCNSDTAYRQGKEAVLLAFNNQQRSTL